MATPGGRQPSTELPALTSVLVVDDHLTFAQLMTLAIELEPDLSCVGHAVNSEQALELDLTHQPDVVLMDVRLPGMDGIDTTRALVARRPTVRVVILSADIGAGVLARAAAAGASAVLTKDGALESLLVAIRTPSRGHVMVGSSVLARAGASRPAPTVTLTPREQAVLELLDAGLDAHAIAQELGIRITTCRGYVKSLLHKIQAHSQLEAVVAARRLGLLGIDKVS